MTYGKGFKFELSIWRDDGGDLTADQADLLLDQFVMVVEANDYETVAFFY